MTQPNPAPAPAAARITFGPGPAQDLSPELAQAVLWQVWKSSPQRFGNFVKLAMVDLWGASSQNGRHSG